MTALILLSIQLFIEDEQLFKKILFVSEHLNSNSKSVEGMAVEKVLSTAAKDLE